MKKTITWQGYQQNGLHFNYENSKTMKVQYTGLLEQSGAEEVYIHYGYGNHWNDTHTVRIHRTHTGFEATVPVTTAHEPINVCFKDNANNWDNNTGWNYKIELDK